MAFTRSAYIRGPGKVTFNGATYQSRGDIRVVIQEDTFPVTTDLYGKVDERIGDRRVEVTFVPDGDVDAIAGLYPLTNIAEYVGTSVFTDDVAIPLVIADRNGRSFTLTDARIVKMPDAVFSPVKTAFGAVTFIGIGSIDWTTATSLVAEGALVWAAPALGDIQTISYGIAWGAAPWDAIETAEGVNVTFNQNVTPVLVDNYGTVDYTYTPLEVSARFRPVNIAAAQLVAKLTGKVQGANAGRGKSIQGADDLVITGTGGAGHLKFTMNKASLKNPALAWGMTTGRMGDLELIATIATTADALFKIELTV
jgi:hypothetical protein